MIKTEQIVYSKQKLLDDKPKLTVIIAVSVIIFHVTLHVLSNRNTQKKYDNKTNNESAITVWEANNFIGTYNGYVDIDEKKQKVFLSVNSIKKNNDSTYSFVYSLKLNLNLVLIDKKGVLQKNNKHIVFLKSKSTYKELIYIKAIDEADYKISSIGKLIIKGIKNNLKLRQN